MMNAQEIGGISSDETREYSWVRINQDRAFQKGVPYQEKENIGGEASTNRDKFHDNSVEFKAIHQSHLNSVESISSSNLRSAVDIVRQRDPYIWEPPLLLQRNVHVDVEGALHTEFFPFEMSQRDYLHRVMDILSHCIRKLCPFTSSSSKLSPHTTATSSSFKAASSIKEKIHGLCSLLFNLSDAIEIYEQFWLDCWRSLNFHSERLMIHCLDVLLLHFQANQLIPPVVASHSVDNWLDRLPGLHQHEAPLVPMDELFRECQRAVRFLCFRGEENISDSPNARKSCEIWEKLLQGLEEQLQLHAWHQHQRMTHYGWCWKQPKSNDGILKPQESRDIGSSSTSTSSSWFSSFGANWKARNKQVGTPSSISGYSRNSNASPNKPLKSNLEDLEHQLSLWSSPSCIAKLTLIRRLLVVVQDLNHLQSIIADLVVRYPDRKSDSVSLLESPYLEISKNQINAMEVSRFQEMIDIVENTLSMENRQWFQRVAQVVSECVWHDSINFLAKWQKHIQNLVHEGNFTQAQHEYNRWLQAQRSLRYLSKALDISFKPSSKERKEVFLTDMLWESLWQEYQQSSLSSVILPRKWQATRDGHLEGLEVLKKQSQQGQSLMTRNLTLEFIYNYLWPTRVNYENGSGDGDGVDEDRDGNVEENVQCSSIASLVMQCGCTDLQTKIGQWMEIPSSLSPATFSLSLSSSAGVAISGPTVDTSAPMESRVPFSMSEINEDNRDRSNRDENRSDSYSENNNDNSNENYNRKKISSSWNESEIINDPNSFDSTDVQFHSPSMKGYDIFLNNNFDSNSNEEENNDDRSTFFHDNHVGNGIFPNSSSFQPALSVDFYVEGVKGFFRRWQRFHALLKSLLMPRAVFHTRLILRLSGLSREFRQLREMGMSQRELGWSQDVERHFQALIEWCEKIMDIDEVDVDVADVDDDRRIDTDRNGSGNVKVNNMDTNDLLGVSRKTSSENHKLRKNQEYIYRGRFRLDFHAEILEECEKRNEEVKFLLKESSKFQDSFSFQRLQQIRRKLQDFHVEVEKLCQPFSLFLESPGPSSMDFLSEHENREVRLHLWNRMKRESPLFLVPLYLISMPLDDDGQSLLSLSLGARRAGVLDYFQATTTAAASTSTSTSSSTSYPYLPFFESGINHRSTANSSTFLGPLLSGTPSVSSVHSTYPTSSSSSSSSGSSSSWDFRDVFSLRQKGFSATVLKLAGYPIESVVTAGYSSEELHAAGLPGISDMKRKNNSAELSSSYNNKPNANLSTRFDWEINHIHHTSQKIPLRGQELEEILQDFYRELGGPLWEQQKGWQQLMMGEKKNRGGGGGSEKGSGKGSSSSRYQSAILPLPYLGDMVGIQGAWESSQDYPQVVKLNLPTNNLQGCLPISLGSLTSLTHLCLSNNQITGELPASLFMLTQLVSLQLQSNRLQGTLSTSFGTLTNLVLLRLDQNQFTGRFPGCLATDMPRLRRLVLSFNQLEGPLPNRWGLKRAGYMSSNPNPSSFALQELLLDNNHFQGPLPSEVESWATLSTLHLQNNRFSGAIPGSWGKLKKLTSLNLSHNDSIEVDRLYLQKVLPKCQIRL